MSISADDVKKIAHLARLAIDESDIPELTKDMSNTLNLVEQMNKVDTSKVEPLAHPLDETQYLREDKVCETNQRDLLLQNAPEAEAGFFIVPQFVETE